MWIPLSPKSFLNFSHPDCRKLRQLRNRANDDSISVLALPQPKRTMWITFSSYLHFAEINKSSFARRTKRASSLLRESNVWDDVTTNTSRDGWCIEFMDEEGCGISFVTVWRKARLDWFLESDWNRSMEFYYSTRIWRYLRWLCTFLRNIKRKQFWELKRRLNFYVPLKRRNLNIFLVNIINSAEIHWAALSSFIKTSIRAFEEIFSDPLITF